VVGVLWLSPAAALAHGAYHDVVREVTALLEKTPSDPALHFRLAKAHQEHGECALALRALARVDELAPGKFSTAFVRGLALIDGQHWENARVVLDGVLRAEPEHAGALAARARVLIELKATQLAIADHRKATELSKEVGAEFFTSWAETLRRHGQLAEAVRTVREGISRAATDPALLSLAVDLEMEAGEFDAALPRLDVLQKLWPRPEPWMVRRAQLLIAAGRAAEARKAWEELRAHILSLPNLERATPHLTETLAQAEKALGVVSPAPVVAPPASPTASNPNSPP
jgi:predicted Zn-dependent protease